MKNKIKNTLIIITVILLSVTTVYLFDKGLNKAKNNSIEKENSYLRKLVLNTADSFDETQKKDSDDLSFIPGYDTENKLVGYVVYAEAPGFASKIKFLIGLDIEGKITGLKILDASKETQGLGTKIQSKKWEALWTGRNIDYEFNKKIDAMSGATITPKGVYLGLKKVLNSYDNIKSESEALNLEIKKIIQEVPVKKSLGKDKDILNQVHKVFPKATAYSLDMLKINDITYMLCYDVNNKIGYFTKLKAEGVDDILSFYLGIGIDGKIIKLTNVDIGKNSAEYNILVKNKAWQSNWTGKDKDYKFDERLDSVGGASISPRVIYDSANKALKAFDKIKNYASENNLPLPVAKDSQSVKSAKGTTAKSSVGTDENIVSQIKKIFPKASAYSLDMKKINGSTFILAYDSNNNELGYFVNLKAEGVEDTLKFDLGIGIDGKIVKLNNVDIGSNSSSYNTLVKNKIWQSKWTGRDKSYRFDDSLDSEAGASVSPRAIYDATKKALKAYEKIKGGN